MSDRMATTPPRPAALAGWACALLAALLCLGCSPKSKMTVVVYTSQDQMYAEPILKEFGQATGIDVRPVFDTESTKTKGLTNRLLAESSNPQCDLFWSNEEMLTRLLEAKNVLREELPWVAVGYRSRRVVINTNLVSASSAPKSLSELTNANWRGKVALAYPLFGTTSSHFMGLREAWGDARWQEWCRGLARNGAFLVDGNSMVVKLVGKGEALVGLTDSDDVSAGQREGLPVAALAMTGETLLIPNSLAVIRNCPNPREADILFEYLQRRSALQKLVDEKALEGVSTAEVSVATLKMNWPAILAGMDTGVAAMQQIFLRQ